MYLLHLNHDIVAKSIIQCMLVKNTITAQHMVPHYFSRIKMIIL